MPGDLLDVVVVVAAVLFAVSGYRQGFVVGVLSLVGFLGGGILGTEVAPAVSALPALEQFSQAVVGLAVVVLLAVTGQVLASLLGSALRRRLTWGPARQADALGGAVVSVIGLLLVAWVVGRAVATSPYPELSSQVRQSVVIGAVDEVVPDTGRRLFTSFRDLIDEQGFPQVFDGLGPTDVRSVPEPDPAVAGSPAALASQASVLKITGVATDCRRRVEGTGFVYAPGRVMTNAHVLAGVTSPQVEVDGQRLDAQVVVFDPATDVAVLAVPGLARPALPFAADPAEPEADAVVVGYPQDGPFSAGSARVRGVLDAQGYDIYGVEEVRREVYALRGQVRPGNSGGPLLDPSGQVLGVIFAAAADDPDVGYALTADEVEDEARAGIAATAPVSTQTCG